MDDMYTEHCHPGRRKEDQTKGRASSENYWDIRYNQGNIYIVTSGDFDDIFMSKDAPDDGKKDES